MVGRNINGYLHQRGCHQSGKALLIGVLFYMLTCNILIVVPPLSEIFAGKGNMAIPRLLHTGTIGVICCLVLGISLLGLLVASPQGVALSQRFKYFRKPNATPLVIAIVIHWLIYFGPINYLAYFLVSDVQDNYSWVISKDYFFEASLLSLMGYNLLVILVILLSRKLRVRSNAAFDRPIADSQILTVAILVSILSLYLSPFIGTVEANHGAWLSQIRFPFSFLAHGLFIFQAVPITAQSIKYLHCDPASRHHHTPRLLLISLLQIIAFICLRQRFFSLLGCLLVLFCLSKSYKPTKFAALGLLGLLGAYILPTALRYTRVARLPGQTLSDYLLISFNNFVTGLVPSNLLSSAVNDFSYNKSGLSSLSVVIDLRSQGLLSGTGSIDWLLHNVSRSLPRFIRQHLDRWPDSGAESLVSRALGVGNEGWSSYGVARGLEKNWVVDMMETPFLDSFTAGGLVSLILFITIFAVFIVVLWNLTDLVTSRLSAFWILQTALIVNLAIGSNWITGSIVAVKTLLPWIIVIVMIGFLSRVILKPRNRSID